MRYFVKFFPIYGNYFSFPFFYSKGQEFFNFKVYLYFSDFINNFIIFKKISQVKNSVIYQNLFYTKLKILVKFINIIYDLKNIIKNKNMNYIYLKKKKNNNYFFNITK